MQTLEEMIAPALDAYTAEIARHGHEGFTAAVDEHHFEARCRCGQTFRKPKRAIANRSVGMHISAAEKRASRAYDAECARLIAARTAQS
jgi:hypothetical protein